MSAVIVPIITGYGVSGQRAVQKMVEALAKHGLSLTYDPNQERFTVLNSQDISCSKIQGIFDTKTYNAWGPSPAVPERDSAGNCLFQLEGVPRKHERLGPQEGMHQLQELDSQLEELENQSEVCSDSAYNSISELLQSPDAFQSDQKWEDCANKMEAWVRNSSESTLKAKELYHKARELNRKMGND